MWKYLKDWIIESLISFVYFFGVPLALCLGNQIVITVDTSSILITVCYVLSIFTVFFTKYIKRGMYAVFDIALKNFNIIQCNVEKINEKSFFWNACFVEKKRVFKKYFEVLSF